MQFRLPLFPLPFELSLPSGLNPSKEQLHTLDQIELRLDEGTMKEVIEKMHKFYVEGQEHFREVVPTLIQLGSMTQAQYDLYLEDCPNTESTEDFINFLEAPFNLHIPEPEQCKEGTFGITCECKWDIEHGVGAWFEDWMPIRVGFAEAGYPY